MLKKTSALGGLAIAAGAAGVMLTSAPASAQVPMHHRGHHVRLVNRNLNVNRNHVIVRVRVANRNNNIAIAHNRGFRFRRFDGFWGPGGFWGDGCCRRRFDGFDGIGRRRFFDDDGVTAIIRGGDIFARAR